MDIFGGAGILIEEVPDIEFKGPHVFVTDRCGLKRVYERKVAIKTFAAFAQKLREHRLSEGAEIIQFPTAERA